MHGVRGLRCQRGPFTRQVLLHGGEECGVLAHLRTARPTQST